MAGYSIGSSVSAASLWLVAALLGCSVLSEMAASSKSKAAVWNGQLFAPDDDVKDKVLTGDGVVTFDDVSAVTCAMKCLTVCGSFYYNPATRACVFSPTSKGTSVVDAPGYQLFYKEGSSDEAAQAHAKSG